MALAVFASLRPSKFFAGAFLAPDLPNFLRRKSSILLFSEAVLQCANADTGHAVPSEGSGFFLPHPKSGFLGFAAA